MTSEYLDCVEIEPEGEANASVIWLHGLGADGNDFGPIVPYLGLEEEVRPRFVFPHAPQIPVTINNGMVMRAWYDITEMDLGRRNDCEGIQRSAAQLSALVERENGRGIASDRIISAGFSQGGAIALYQGLRYAERLAGILALSTYLVMPEELATERSEANLNTPIFQAHGTFDPMVPFQGGELARRQLEDLGYQVEWHQYPMQHQVVPQEIEAIGDWMNRILG